MTNLDQAFQKAYAKGRATATAPADNEWSAAPHYDLAPAAALAIADDPYAYEPVAANFRLQSPDWMAGVRELAPVMPAPPMPMAERAAATPAPAMAQVPTSAPVVAEEKPAAAAPAPIPAKSAATVVSLPVSISLSGVVTTPMATEPTAEQTAEKKAEKQPEKIKETPKQLRVEAKQPIAAPHIGRARHASSRAREAAPAMAKSAEAWPALPAFEPIWEVDRLEWPAVLETLFNPAREDWNTLVEQIVRRVALGRNLLAVAGCHSGDGATTLALGIAKAAAARGMKVALIDANTESPGIGQTLRLHSELGWEQALLGEKTLSETAVTSLAEGVNIFPLTNDCQSSDAPWEDAVVEAFPLLATRHHLVIVDLGTIAGEEETPPSTNRMVGATAGLALLVRDARHSGASRAAAARRQLAAAGLELMGVVENYT